MLIVTDLEAVNTIFNAKMPRDHREVMLEIYPDATEDRNGRFHAPHDGYECPITGKTFRAGEYLPMEEPEDAFCFSGGERKFPKAIDLTGVKHEWDGSPAQNREVWAELIRQSKAHDAATSNYIGTVGEKLTLDLTVSHIHDYFGYYGTVFINIMKDVAGNVVIYKGAKKLAAKGEAIRVACKVKSHGEREGVKQTVIERPTLPKIKPEIKERAQLANNLAKLVRSGTITPESAQRMLRDFDAKTI